MPIRRELIDELLHYYPDPQDVLAEDGLLKQLTKAVIERCLETELDTHLGYPKHGRAGIATGNRRNGHSQKRGWTPYSVVGGKESAPPVSSQFCPAA